MTAPIAHARSCGPTRAAPPTSDDLAEAAEWLAGHTVRTPVLRAAGLDRAAGARLWLKAENLQVSGSYAFRGALRAVGRVVAEQRHDGVVTPSTGNHGLAIATAASRFGLAAVVVLPPAAGPEKVRALVEVGGEPVTGGRTVDERAETARRLARERGFAVLDPHDDVDVVAGHATATLELLQQVDEAGGRLDAVVVPVGGGAGIAGACLALRDDPVDVYGVEPSGCDPLARSLLAGRRIAVPPSWRPGGEASSTCVGELPFRLARERVAGVVRIDERTVGDALRRLARHAKILVEPSAAAVLAAAPLVARRGYRDLGLMVTCGNLAPAEAALLLDGGAVRDRL